MAQLGSKGWLYLPMEVKVRELYGKVLLAIEAAKSGFDVVLGKKAEIYRIPQHLPPGVVLHISSQPEMLEIVNSFRRHGHKNIALDEEALAYPDDEMYVRARLSRDVISRTDAVLCWGSHHADLVKQKSAGTDCIIEITGNPRFDLLRAQFRGSYAMQVSEIQRAHAPFILVNTNFSFCNPKLGTKGYFELLRSRGIADDPHVLAYTKRRIEWKRLIFEAFSDLLPELSAAFPNHNVILRPHPSENHDYWREKFASSPKIKVIHSGNVIPWIIAGDLLVENSCTTALEAFVVGTPTVAYRPFIEPRMEAPITQLVCAEASSQKELFSTASLRMGSRINGNSQQSERLAAYLANLNGSTAVKTIIEVLRKIESPPRDIVRERNLRHAWLRELLLNVGKRLMMRAVRNQRQPDYQAFKFPRLDPGELKGIINSLSACSENPVPLSFRRVAASCYHLRHK